MSKRAGATVVEVKGSHAVYVSQPQAVASLIERAATGAKVAEAARRSRSTHDPAFAPPPSAVTPTGAGSTAATPSRSVSTTTPTTWASGAPRDQRRPRGAGRRLRHPRPPRTWRSCRTSSRGARAQGQRRRRGGDPARGDPVHAGRHRREAQRVQPLEDGAGALPADLDRARKPRPEAGLRPAAPSTATRPRAASCCSRRGTAATGSIRVAQDVDLWLARIGAGESRGLELRPGRSVWLHVARGSVSLNEHEAWRGRRGRDQRRGRARARGPRGRRGPGVRPVVVPTCIDLEESAMEQVLTNAVLEERLESAGGVDDLRPLVASGREGPGGRRARPRLQLARRPVHLGGRAARGGRLRRLRARPARPRQVGRRALLRRADRGVPERRGDADDAREEARAGAAVFLLGHSAGGVISSVYTLDHQAELAGLICESFAFQVPAPDFALSGDQGPEPHRAAPGRAAAQERGLLARSRAGEGAERGPAHGGRDPAGDHRGRDGARRRPAQAGVPADHAAGADPPRHARQGHEAERQPASSTTRPAPATRR